MQTTMQSFNWSYNMFAVSFFALSFLKNVETIVRMGRVNAQNKFISSDLNELEYWKIAPEDDQGLYVYTDDAAILNKGSRNNLNDDFPDYKMMTGSSEPVEPATKKGLIDAIQDTLGFPKFSFKLPFLKGRFSLAAKLLPEEKTDADTEDLEIEPQFLESFRKHIKLTYPGTMWCEDGNIFRVKKDYGQFYKADTCCKNHDKCPMKISSGDMKNKLKNLGIYKRSHCDCDKEFFNCLKVVNTLVSNKIGYTYFNILKPQCFRFDYPVIGCSKRLHNNCLTYVIDDTKNKTWQWFDNKFF